MTSDPNDCLRVSYVDPDLHLRITKYYKRDAWTKAQSVIGEMQLRGVEVSAKRFSADEMNELLKKYRVDFEDES